MARQAPQRRTTTAVAVFVGVLLLAAPVAASAAPAEGRPPAHAARGEGAPPPHAHSPAPEGRPPAHAAARRASARHASDTAPRAEARDAGSATPPSGAPGRASSTPPAGGPPPSAAGRAPGPPAEGPPDHAPARGRAEPGGSDAELDTDRVVDGPAPSPDRRPSAAGPVLAPPPPLVLVAASALDVTTAPFAALVPAPATPAPVDGADPGADADDDGGQPGSDVDPLAAPDALDVAPVFEAELTRRVVVPVVVLVAGLVYLLAQGRIDRRAELLLAPLAPGTEHDEDVFRL